MQFRGAVVFAVFVFGCSSPEPDVARAALGSTGLVISQVYGGGGNSGAPLTNDYVELFNRGTADVSLSGLSIQYASAAGATWTPLSLGTGTVAPGKYFLVQLAGGATGSALPTPDLASTVINMSGTSGKVALVNGTTAISCVAGSDAGVPACSTLASIIDLVGYGTASDYEGLAAAPILSNTKANVRAGGGCTDTDNNTADFATATPSPATVHNSGSATNDCNPPDLSVPVDLSEPPDLTDTTDLTGADMTGMPDLTVLPDLTAAPTADLMGTAGAVVISQIYGGGGNTLAAFTNDYIELFNRSTSTVDLTGWSLQYGSATANFSSKVDLPSATLAPGKYFLVQLSGGATGAALPTPDFAPASSFNMSVTAGKLALVPGTTQLTCGATATPCAAGQFVDLVGWGNSTTFEGTVTPAPASGNNGAALFRKNAGCIDTDDNAADVEVGSVAGPRNGATAAYDCSAPPPPDLSVPLDMTAPPDLKPPPDLTPGPDLAGPPPTPGIVVISQLYGGGGNSGATYTHDYVELFNRTSATVDMSGWSIQYGSAANNFSLVSALPIGATIAPGHYYLVQLSMGALGSALPTPDYAATGTAALNLSATAGKVALVGNTTVLACGATATPCNSVVIVDLVGYGTTSTAYEGTGPAHAPSTNAGAIFRNNFGCSDTDQNANDFFDANAAPRNSASPAVDCSALPDLAVPIDMAVSNPVDMASGGVVDLATPNLADFAPPHDMSHTMPRTDGGCSCDLGGQGSPNVPALLLLALLLSVRWRSRRRSS
jgi:MYXO-CTERM domain-containing protein